MNLKNIHSTENAVSAKKLFTTSEGNVTSISLKASGILKEHVSSVPAILLCVNGSAVFKNENGVSEDLSTGDYIQIEPNVKHLVQGITDTQLILIK